MNRDANNCRTIIVVLGAVGRVFVGVMCCLAIF